MMEPQVLDRRNQVVVLPRQRELRIQRGEASAQIMARRPLMVELRSKLLDRCEECEGPLEGSPCWRWTQKTTPKGYGHVWWQGREERAHRMSWLAFRGPIPEGLHVLHKCDVRDCINPDHLYVGTHQDNMSDMWRRNHPQVASGEDHCNAVLTKTKAAEVLFLALEGQLSLAQIGAEYGISKKLVLNIKTGKAWKGLKPIKVPWPEPKVLAGFHRRV